MLKNTFIIYDRIGKIKEKNLWNSGIKDWNDFLNQKKIKSISDKSKAYYDRKINETITALREGDSSYFCNKLDTAENWRLYDYFREETAFIDIETSGVGKNSYLTIFGLFDGIDTKIMIKDINFDIKSLKKELVKYKLIVTFNGSSFDIPFLNKRYPELIPKIPHFDLKHVCLKLELKGGLKQVEKEIGIKRKNDYVDRMYGGDAFYLWRRFKATGDDYFLRLLIEYNEEDIINLKKICDYVVEKLKKNYL